MVIPSAVAGIYINCELIVPVSWLVLLSRNIELASPVIMEYEFKRFRNLSYPPLPLRPEARMSACVLFISLSGHHPSGH
jgi:hypothetical protein